MHRNSQKRIYGDYVYFITCDVQDKIEFFKEEILCEFWIEELRLAKEIKQFKLYAFCLNYEHFHLLIKPGNEIADYSKIMQFLKRHLSRNANIVLGYNKIDLEKLSAGDDVESDIGQCRIRLRNFRDKFIKKFGEEHNLPKFKWQKSFHDHIIRDENDFNDHWNYTMYNFLKHNLTENWKYTGLNYTDLIDDIE